MRSLIFFTLAAFSISTVPDANAHPQQPPPNQQHSYIDDDDQRPLADLKFEVDRRTSQNLRITISATGPDVEPIAGYRGIQGANRYTAEELALILNGNHSVRLVTEYDNGVVVEGEIIEGRYDKLPQRRLLPDGHIDHLGQTAWSYPIEIIVDPQTSTSGLRNTMVYVDGLPRLRCRYRIEAGRLADLQVQSLGNDRYLTKSINEFEKSATGIRIHKATRQFFTVKLPDDWNQRDAEGKWSVIMTLINENPITLRDIAGELAKRQEFELLEWLAITVPDAFKSNGVIDALVKADAPQWIRVAAWHSTGPRNLGHSLQVASNHLQTSNPAVVEAWLLEHQDQIDNWDTSIYAIYELLSKDKTERGDSSGYLKPLQPDEVFKLLTPAKTPVDFGNRKMAKPGVIYKQQVIRAINAVPVSGRRYPEYLARLRKLTSYRDDTIRIHAFLAHTYLLEKSPGNDRFDDFLKVIDDKLEAANVREAALMAFSYHRHPSVILKLHQIAADTDHGAWNAAVSRLGDIGKEFSIEALDSLDDSQLSDEQQNILEATAQRLRKRHPQSRKIGYREMMLHIQLAAYAEQTQDANSALIRRSLDSAAKRLQYKDWKVVSKYDQEKMGSIWIPGDQERFNTAFRTIQESIQKPSPAVEGAD